MVTSVFLRGLMDVTVPEVVPGPQVSSVPAGIHPQDVCSPSSWLHLPSLGKLPSGISLLEKPSWQKYIRIALDGGDCMLPRKKMGTTFKSSPGKLWLSHGWSGPQFQAMISSFKPLCNVCATIWEKSNKYTSAQNSRRQLSRKCLLVLFFFLSFIWTTTTGVSWE